MKRKCSYAHDQRLPSRYNGKLSGFTNRWMFPLVSDEFVEMFPRNDPGYDPGCDTIERTLTAYIHIEEIALFVFILIILHLVVCNSPHFLDIEIVENQRHLPALLLHLLCLLPLVPEERGVELPCIDRLCVPMEVMRLVHLSERLLPFANAQARAPPSVLVWKR